MVLEEYPFEQILKELVHADGLCLLAGPHRAQNAASWVQGVAERHLDRDGLAPSQRRNLRRAEDRKRQPAAAGAFNEGFQNPEVTPESVEIAKRYAKRLKASWEL